MEDKVQASRHKQQESGNRQPEIRRLSYKEKREFDLLEKEIADLNTEKEMITQKFNEGSLPFEELQQLSQRIGEISTLLDGKEMRWLELSEMMDAEDR
jgi:ATP-binding cassette subfamily F protein uup